MAVELHQGGYALQQESSKKIVVQLKLTDSALRALEVFKNFVRADSRLNPSITFEGNQGIIQIPVHNKDRDGFQTYTFQLSTLPQSTPIDCLRQTQSRNSSGKVTVLSEIQQKITVHANDDTYNATKKRMEKVKELEKNTSTKVLKQVSSSKFGTKKKFLGRLDHTSINSSAAKTSHSFSRSASPLLPSHSSQTTAVGDPIGVRNKTKPILSSLSTSFPPSRSVTDKVLQEKILHYLAIRPINFHDLQIRLTRIIGYVDKEKVKTILSQVSKTNDQYQYVLNKSCLASIELDWAGYSEDERNAVKRQLDALRFGESRKRSATATNIPSKDSSIQATLLEESYSNPVKKKQRVSLYKASPNLSRPRSISPDQPLSVGNPALTSLLSSSSIVDLNAVGVNESLPDERKNVSKSIIGDRRNRHYPKTGLVEDTKVSKPLNSPSNTVTTKSSISYKQRGDLESKLHSTEQVRSHGSSSTSLYDSATIIPSPEDTSSLFSPDDDDFTRKYHSICYAEERKRYKDDFYAEYKEYLELHRKLATQSRRFAKYEEELQKEELYTEQYKLIARKVYDEYCKLKQEGVYLRQRARFAYLYRKLKYIKNFVLEYDQKQFAPTRGKDMAPLLST